MNERHKFYYILGILGAVSGVGQWLMFRHGAEFLNSELGLLFFLLLPLVYVLPYTKEAHFPISVSKLLARLGGYWFIFAFMPH